MKIAIILLVAVCLFLLFREWQRNDTRIREMERLDAIAALDKEKTELNFHTSLIENAMGHLANAMQTGTVREKK